MELFLPGDTVRWVPRMKKWRSSIQNDKKMIYLGSFTELIDAIASRKEAEEKFGFHVNHGEDKA